MTDESKQVAYTVKNFGPDYEQVVLSLWQENQRLEAELRTMLAHQTALLHELNDLRLREDVLAQELAHQRRKADLQAGMIQSTAAQLALLANTLASTREGPR